MIFPAGDLTRAKRATKYTVELAIAVDKGMVDYYGDELDDVVKSNAVLISDIYEKSNLKQSISVSLVEIIRLPVDLSGGPLAGTNGVDAQKLLTNFCEYVMKNSSVKYDAAMLITRYLLPFTWI